MQITLVRPDDWHLHLRDGAALSSVLPHSARQFARAIIMPNLRPPVTTVAAAADYRQRILAALPAGAEFEPLMTLYLTDNTPADEIRRAVDSGFVKAVKTEFAGPHGCTHVSELLMSMPTAAFQAFAGQVKHEDRVDGDQVPFHLDRCHALSLDSDVVRRFYPRWYRGQNPGQENPPGHS